VVQFNGPPLVGREFSLTTLMRWIVEQRQAGLTWERIYLELAKRKERTRSGREWSVSRIRRAYAAEVAGKTRTNPQTTQEAPPEAEPGGRVAASARSGFAVGVAACSASR
jgi:hypothetical protein